MVSGVRQEDSYKAIQYLNKTEKYPIDRLCAKLHICRSAYYKWLKREPSQHQKTNEQLVKWIKELYEEQNGILGYRHGISRCCGSVKNSTLLRSRVESSN